MMALFEGRGDPAVSSLRWCRGVVDIEMFLERGNNNVLMGGQSIVPRITRKTADILCVLKPIVGNQVDSSCSEIQLSLLSYVNDGIAISIAYFTLASFLPQL